MCFKKQICVFRKTQIRFLETQIRCHRICVSKNKFVFHEKANLCFVQKANLTIFTSYLSFEICLLKWNLRFSKFVFSLFVFWNTNLRFRKRQIWKFKTQIYPKNSKIWKDKFVFSQKANLWFLLGYLSFEIWNSPYWCKTMMPTWEKKSSDWR